MENISKKLQSIRNLFKNIFEKFPMTILTIIIITTIYTISIDNDIFSITVLNNIGLFSVLFGSGSFFIETIKEEKGKRNILYYIISFIIAISLTCLSNIENPILEFKNPVFLDIIVRIDFCYIISIIIATIYIQFKKSQLDFEEYITRVAINIFKTSIVYGVLSIGTLIITTIFNFLILNGEDYYINLRMETLLLGLFYLPRVLYSFFELDGEVGKFAKGMFKYVLDVLVIIAFIIIYLYIGKIIILRDIPSNQIYRIIASLFIIGCPIWTMASYFKEKDLLSKINSKLPILFIPFILLQIYSIGVRIYSNGVTEARYLCVLLILIEIIYIIIYLKNKEKIGNILLICIIATIISSVVPYINMFNISKESQISNLKILKQKDEYSDADKTKIRGAYYYLKNISNGEKIIEDLLTDDDIDTIINFGEITSNDTCDLYSSVHTSDINVKGYNNIYFVNNYGKIYDTKNIKDTFENLTLTTEDNSQYFYLDLSNIINDYLENSENFDEYFDEHHEFEIDEERKLIIEYIFLKYDLSGENIKSFSIKGYLLVK